MVSLNLSPMSQDMDPGLGGGSYLGVQTWEMPQKQPTSVAEMMIHQLISGDLIFRPICIYIYTYIHIFTHYIYRYVLVHHGYVLH